MIIGLSGYAGSGKDTVAEILVREHGFTRIAFADKLKQFAYEMNPAVGVDVWQDEWEPSNFGADPIWLRDVVDKIGWDDGKRLYPGVRQVLQDAGVAGRKTFGENHWVNLVLEEIWNSNSDTKWVVTDVRFPNEAQAILHALDGRLLRIERDGVGPVNGHVSETALDDWPFGHRIFNRGTLEDLATSVEQLVTEGL